MDKGAEQEGRVWSDWLRKPFIFSATAAERREAKNAPRPSREATLSALAAIYSHE